MEGLAYATPRALGLVETPDPLVRFMVGLLPPKGPSRVLEPACGEAPFLRAFAEAYGRGHRMVGVEIHPERAQRARERVPFAEILEGDFLLLDLEGGFDIVLGNPPYGAVGEEGRYPIHPLRDRRKAYRRLFSTWKGRYNLYGAFLEKAVRLLRPGGRLGFLVPAGWFLLEEFARLRAFLAWEGGLRVFYLGRVFPGRKVRASLLLFERGGKGLELYEGERLLLRKERYTGEPIRFETPELLAWERDGVPLGEVFEVRFAARSPEFARHPEVYREPRPGTVPVLTGRNLRPGFIDYETPYSGLWMPREKAPELRAFYAIPHIVVGHTKGTRVVAALDERAYPWREEFHLLPKRGVDERGFVEYLNDPVLAKALRLLYRDITPHLTRAQLLRIPIPSRFLA